MTKVRACWLRHGNAHVQHRIEFHLLPSIAIGYPAIMVVCLYVLGETDVGTLRPCLDLRFTESCTKVASSLCQH
jgi:hypothetical protein